MSLAQRVDDLSSLVQSTSGNAALAVLTLQNVGHISSQHGLTASSTCLAEFTERVNALLRPCDQMLVLSDDRVCIVFDDLMDDNHVLLAGLKIERAFEEPLSVEGHQLILEVRAGIIYFGRQERLNGMSPEDLYRFAESAREHAVQRKTCFEVSSEETFARMRQDWETDQSIQNAMEEHALTLDYQPKYRLSDGELVGAEAIVRWRNDGTIIPPEHFMSALSETHVWDLTIYSLRRAIREMVEFGSSPPVAVNIVQSVLEHPSFLKSVQNELNIWDLAPSRLAFEIAESQAIHDDKNMLGLLETMREMGIGVIIDEFGTGHASLEKIRDLPADQIKIDRRFVTNVCENSDDQRITETIIDLAHRFSMTVVADGVEDAETFGYLMEANCDVGQGFYLGAPLNNAQFAGLLKDLV